MEVTEMVSRKRIAFVTTGAFPVPAVRGGAAEALVEELLKENEVEQKAEFTVISISDEEAAEAGKENYPHTSFAFIQPALFWIGFDKVVHFFAYQVFHSSRHLAYKTMFQRLNYIYKVSVYLHEQKFDKVVYENQMALLWTLKYKNNSELYQNKYYFHLHNHPARYAGNEKLAAGSDRILAVSSFIGHAFAKHIGIDYTEDKFYVLRNVVDEKLFDPDTVSEDSVSKIREKLNLQNKQVILFLGRLIPGKGVAELLKAYQQMKTENTILLIVGSFNFNNAEHSPYEKVLQDLIQKIGTDQVRFTGYVDHDQVPVYYQLADLVILPSTCDDAAPLAVIETMMMHRPLITTTAGGIPEYADPSCAVLLENNEHLIQEITRTADELLNDPERRKAMSENAAEVTKDWTLKRFYEDFLRGVDA